MSEVGREQRIDAGPFEMDSGLILSMNECINSFLLSTSQDPSLSPDLRELASSLSAETSISYRSLRTIWLNSSPSEKPPLRHLFSGLEFILQRPKPREKV